MSGNKARTEMFSDADGRSTEMQQRSHCVADCSKWWEGQATDSRENMSLELL